jgi:hypothetical protein
LIARLGGRRFAATVATTAGAVGVWRLGAEDESIRSRPLAAPGAAR